MLGIGLVHHVAHARRPVVEGTVSTTDGRQAAELLRGRRGQVRLRAVRIERRVLVELLLGLWLWLGLIMRELRIARRGTTEAGIHLRRVLILEGTDILLLQLLHDAWVQHHLALSIRTQH